VLFSEKMTDPKVADQARRQYACNYPEQPLLAYVINETNHWLADVALSEAPRRNEINTC
jgi:hypothetical protein